MLLLYIHFFSAHNPVYRSDPLWTETHTRELNIIYHMNSADTTKPNNNDFDFIKKKVKQSRYRPGQAQRVLRKLMFPHFVTTA